MKDFIYELYKDENFTTYLIIALVVLIILFVIVLIFGKRDQKLEETKRLAKLELEAAFKEDKKEPEKVEVPQQEEIAQVAPQMEVKTEEVVMPPLMNEIEQPKLEEVIANVNNNAVETPVFEENAPLFTNNETQSIFDNITSQLNEEPNELVKAPKESFFDDTTYIPKIEIEKNPTVTTFEPIATPVKEEPVVSEPIIKNVNEFFGFGDIEDEQKPINLSELPKLDEIDKKMEEGLSSLENLKQEINNIELPRLNDEEPKKAYKPGPQVFSSVFVNKAEEINQEEPKSLFESEEKIIMPTLEEPKKEETVKIFGFDSDDDDDEMMELPTLK